MIHKQPHALAGQTVTIASHVTDIGGQEFVIEDWWDRIAGKSWMWCDGNPAKLGSVAREHVLQDIIHLLLLGAQNVQKVKIQSTR